MRNDYNNLITVDEYVKSLRNDNNPNDESMITAEDYAKSLRTQFVKYQASSLMTVQDYVKSLDVDDRYVTEQEKAISKKIELAISKQETKAEKDAKLLEKLLA